MRLVLLLSFLVWNGYSLAGQAASVVVLTAKMAESPPSTAIALRTELQEIIDGALATTTYGSLGCQFELEATSSQQISGMAKRTIARYTYTLTFLDYVLDFPVGEPLTGTVTGSGDNPGQATSNALSKLRKSHFSADKLQQVITEHRNLLPQCGELITRLESLQRDGQSTAVLAVAAQLAETGECPDAVERLVSDVYREQQAADCRQLIIRAKAEVVAGNLPRAARLLAGVDPTLDCAAEVETLLDELMKKDTVGARLQWYRTARQSAIISVVTRRRIISNLVLEYAYQNY